ncbi:DISARM system phospholipase D-like protein DrmC [Candidatus Poriferisodalis sp.]|uniref:DISARM system phospholipase D-like protein DrmC n=1 Tax=Candidatus Poriferisodalis sp. TaxID=3101277 RepID=UPI003B0246C2
MDLEAAAIQFVLNEPTERIEGLIRALNSGRVHAASSRAHVARQHALGGTSLDRTMGLLRAWRDDNETIVRLPRLLNALLEIRDAVQRRSTQAELVWTGHRLPGSPLRGTSSVLREMLDAARSNVIVMSYSVWLGSARVDAAFDHLVTARRRGVQVTFVVDRDYSPDGSVDGHNCAQLRLGWPADAPKPDVYIWGDDDDQIAKLHAKVIAVDRRDLLITSANLTSHGLSGNLELGTRLVGRPAAQAHDHVFGLISNGTFVRERLW